MVVDCLLVYHLPIRKSNCAIYKQKEEEVGALGAQTGMSHFKKSCYSKIRCKNQIKIEGIDLFAK